MYIYKLKMKVHTKIIMIGDPVILCVEGHFRIDMESVLDSNEGIQESASNCSR